MKPPTFFLSSTIYDFRDLRSALKYYLEQQGCRVLASDYNDFPKPLDTHSYEACLKAIGECDYFVLLIGARVGGWFNEVEQVSITQQEYRHAYSLHLQGKLKLLSFVRSEVWRMKDDRKLLEKHIATLDLDPGAKNQVLLAPTKSATNAEFVVRFIEEVGKNRETAASAQGKGTRPTGNWLHQFESFKDVVEPIQLQAFSNLPVEEAALRRLLKQELREILRRCLLPGGAEGNAYSPRIAIYNFYATLTKPLSLDQATTAVNTQQYRRMVSLWMHVMQTKFAPQILSEAVRSSAFMEYDRVSGEMREMPVHDALLKLLMEIQGFGLKDSSDLLKLVLKGFPRSDQPQTTVVNSMHLFMLLHSIDRWSNIIDLCRSIVVFLEGGRFVVPNLRPRSPMYCDDDLVS
ncbi:MAG TPA: DUF4062 domain-containing protein [Pirellulaceae bacterium]|jgi:hypothetical protein|nr:DUF4062 domain-containing protein [Pirellulaceae bacterium]